MRPHLLVPTLLLAVTAGFGGTEPFAVISPGEELHYSVRWTLFRLGSIAVRVLADSTCSGPDEIKIVVVARSNPDLSFYSLTDSCISYASPATLWSSRFIEHCREGEQRTVQLHWYDSLTRCVRYTVTEPESGRRIRSDTLCNIGPYVEGPSLFTMARVLARTLVPRRIPTLIGGRLQATDLYFDEESGETEINAVEYPIRTRRLSGIAHWSGSAAGLSGEFSGWVTDDRASVPVRAEMRIMVGSVVIELERWHRPGWLPPPAQSILAD